MEAITAEAPSNMFVQAKMLLIKHSIMYTTCAMRPAAESEI